MRRPSLIGNRAAARLMRQATATRAGSLRVKIVAHASPRWTDARTPAEADPSQPGRKDLVEFVDQASRRYTDGG